MAANPHTLALYKHIQALPEGVVGEIIDGQLHTHPRPGGVHAATSTALASLLTVPYRFGRGGPGGRWILDEPECHFVRDTEVLVPDIAGWRRERMPELPVDQRFELAPDWVCEILSPSTAGIDRDKKMPTYARHGVTHLWLIEPKDRRLEAYELHHGAWTSIGQVQDDQDVCLPPFSELRFSLADLWR